MITEEPKELTEEEKALQFQQFLQNQDRRIAQLETVVTNLANSQQEITNLLKQLGSGGGGGELGGLGSLAPLAKMFLGDESSVDVELVNAIKARMIADLANPSDSAFKTFDRMTRILARGITIGSRAKLTAKDMKALDKDMSEA